LARFSVLITLDGTRSSEEALMMLRFLKSLGVDVVQLVSVWQELDGPQRQAEAFKEASERGHAFLGEYLESKAASLRSPDLQVEPIVRIGSPAEEVLRIAKETRADLIVIATHGRAGIERWRLGSIADTVVRQAPCPVLVIGPRVEVALESYKPRRIMVPLDGTSLAEIALPVTDALAKCTGAAVDLVEVAYLPTTWRLDAHVGDLLDSLEGGAVDYLGGIDLPGGRGGARLSLQPMLTGGIAEALIACMRERQAELVVMASHGRHGLLRAALGSVTDDVLRGPVPVLVLRPGEDRLSALIAAG
jgi:nucleotide-binding universal stress UspA family protein